MEVMWNDLVRWLKEIDDRAIVHKALTLRSSNPSTTTNHQHQRGLFTSDTVHRGEILIQLPLAASINGKSMPCTYDIPNIRNSNGDNFPAVTASARKVSPWLRCLAALIQELRQHDERRQQPQQSSYYLASLPHEYETMWRWRSREVEEYLAGTRPPTYNDAIVDDPTNIVSEPTTAATPNHSNDKPPPISSASNPWMIMKDSKQIRQQYDRTIRPYLIHCGILQNASNGSSNQDADGDTDGEKREQQEYQTFEHACQILSTRSFYSSSSLLNDDKNTLNDDYTTYDGPYLLPIIDLINHADTCTGRTNTKLEYLVQPHSSNASYFFVMRALCTIQPNSEILHSYGDELSNYQFLSSFGFIPINRMISSQQQLHDQQQEVTKSSPCTAPANGTINNSFYTKSVIITKQEIWDTCWDIIESGLPQQLAASMIESQAFDPDEVWNVNIDRHRKVDCVPNNITVLQPPSSSEVVNEIDDDVVNKTNHSMLSDELVTTASVPFLPKCAYAEITSLTLLDESLLQDYYLGQLVGTALLQSIQRRLSLYRPIPIATIQRLLPSLLLSDNVNVLDDKGILRILLQYIDQNSTGSESCSGGNLINQTTTSDMYIERCRLAYGLTIRLEEKEVLKVLGNTIVQLVNGLNKDNNDGIQFDSDNTAKKIKPSED